jgi:hypothetical protein
MRVLPGTLIALASACTYPEWDLDSDTVLKCDPQNPCPEDYFCTGGSTAGGRCYQQGLVGCANQPLSRYWGFDSDAEDWSFDYDRAGASTGTMAWTADNGWRGGALEAELTGMTASSARLAWIRPPLPIEDLTAKLISARIWVDRPGLLMKIYVNNSGNGAGWTDGGAAQLDPSQWACVTLDIANPAYTDPNRPLDPTQVYQLGLQLDGLLGGEKVTVRVDDVGF